VQGGFAFVAGQVFARLFGLADFAVADGIFAFVLLEGLVGLDGFFWAFHLLWIVGFESD
jgi:hypothetical protein